MKLVHGRRFIGASLLTLACGSEGSPPASMTGGAAGVGASGNSGGSTTAGGNGGAAASTGNGGSGAVSPGGAGGSGAAGASGGAAGSSGSGGSGPSGGASGAGGSSGTGGSSGAGGSGATGGSSGGDTGGTGGSGGTGGTGGGGGIFDPPYILGADISWTLEQESVGRTYRDGGRTKSVERIFVDHGFNYIRLRTFVCPDCPGGYTSALYSGARPTEAFCDTAHTITMARRVKACGMGLFLDFHMSDTWASIGEQHVPSAWAGMNASQMQAAAYEYVKGVLDEMVAAGVKPDMVQVGNETNSRMSGVSMSNWAAFSGLVNSGVRAVREIDPNIIVWGQHGRPRPDGNWRAWVDDYLTNDPPIDVDGLCGSTYGTTNNGQDWIEEFGYVIDTYGLPVMSCEYTDVRRDLINPIMRNFRNGMGRGTFLWEPTAYGDRQLFDFSNDTYTTNANMDEYARIAREYGLPVPSKPASELEGTTCR